MGWNPEFKAGFLKNVTLWHGQISTLDDLFIRTYRKLFVQLFNPFYNSSVSEFFHWSHSSTKKALVSDMKGFFRRFISDSIPERLVKQINSFGKFSVMHTNSQGANYSRTVKK